MFAVDANYTITATCGNDYKVFVNGVEVTLPYTVAQTYEEQEITVTGYGYFAENPENQVAATPLTFTVPAMARPVTNDPTINVTMGEGNYSATVTITGEGTLYYSVDGENWTEYTEAIVYDVEGEYTIYAKADMGGDYVESGVVEETFTVEAPVPPVQEQAENPVINVETEYTTATIIITTEEEGATIWYRIGDGAFMPYPEDGVIYEGEAGEYVVEAYAVVDGKLASEIVSETFVLEEQPEEPTSVDELFNGKTVASTRYFNMAGQELSEANGVCIIVTTYTDGTKSAVKVMK